MTHFGELLASPEAKVIGLLARKSTERCWVWRHASHGPEAACSSWRDSREDPVERLRTNCSRVLATACPGIAR